MLYNFILLVWPLQCLGVRTFRAAQKNLVQLALCEAVKAFWCNAVSVELQAVCCPVSCSVGAQDALRPAAVCQWQHTVDEALRVMW